MQPLTEGLIIVVDPKAITYGDTLALDLNVDNIYYQLDTVEFSDTAADNKYLLNLKEFFNSKFDPVSIRDAYYLDKEHSHIKGRLNLISGVFDQKSNNQYFKDNEDYFTELASLFSEEDDSVFEIYQRATKNEEKIGEECKFQIETGKRHLPEYELTEEESKKFKDNEDLFWHIIGEGMKESTKRQNA